MAKKIIHGVMAVAIPVAMAMAIAAEARAGNHPDPILGPQSCYWKTKNWFCRPL